MNECQQSEKVSAYHDGELSPASAADMKRHLAACPQCSAELERIRELSTGFAAMPAPQVPPHVVARLHARVDQLAARSVFRFAEGCAAIAAAVLIACTVGLFKQSAPVQPAASLPVWEAPAAIGENVELVSGGADEVLAGWTVLDLSGKGEHE